MHFLYMHIFSWVTVMNTIICMLHLKKTAAHTKHVQKYFFVCVVPNKIYADVQMSIGVAASLSR